MTAAMPRVKSAARHRRRWGNNLACILAGGWRFFERFAPLPAR
jgi:hypothetical protein